MVNGECEIRPYVDADLMRLQAALADWTRQSGGCAYCHPGYVPHLLYEKLRGCGLPALVHIWEQHEQLVGMAINGLFETSFLVYLGPALRGSPIERAMLQVAYQTTRQHLDTRQASETLVNTDVYSCDVSRLVLLQELGFRQHRVWDYITERGLSEALPAPILPAGFSIRAARLDEYAELALLRNDAFGEDWTPEIYRDNLMLKAGSRPEHEIVVVAPDGQLAASTIMRLDYINMVGLFEPVATRHAFHRRGLGRAMLLYALAEMQRLGMRRARVEYAATNLAAHGLYASLGFEKVHETLGYEL